MSRADDVYDLIAQRVHWLGSGRLTAAQERAVREVLREVLQPGHQGVATARPEVGSKWVRRDVLGSLAWEVEGFYGIDGDIVRLKPPLYGLGEISIELGSFVDSWSPVDRS